MKTRGSIPWLVKAHGFVRRQTCPFEKIESAVPREGSILDLGCGYGYFPLLMAARSPKRAITALDWQEPRIRVAQELCRRRSLPVTFRVADIRTADFTPSDAIVMLDSLYLLPPAEQKNLLMKCSRSLNRGGKLVIKETDVRPGHKYLWCLFQEMVATRLLNINHSRGIHIIPRQEMVRQLQGLGFTVQVTRLDRGYWYPHVMYVCEKP